MTKEEFIKGYCERSWVTWEFLKRWRDAVPCDCAEQYCEGWAMVPKIGFENHLMEGPPSGKDPMKFTEDMVGDKWVWRIKKEDGPPKPVVSDDYFVITGFTL